MRHHHAGTIALPSAVTKWWGPEDHLEVKTILHQLRVDTNSIESNRLDLQKMHLIVIRFKALKPPSQPAMRLWSLNVASSG